MSHGKNKPVTTALAVIDSSRIADRTQLAKFQAHTLEQLGLIEKNETQNTMRRVFVGLALCSIKASLKHGEWGAWFAENVKGTSLRHANYMMSAGWVFVEQMLEKAPELVAIASGEKSLALTDGAPPAKIAKAAAEFVGDMTWGELLDAHDIRNRKALGGKRVKFKKGGASKAPTPEQLYQFARDEIGLAIAQAETVFVKENKLLHLAGHPEEIRGAVASLRKLADRVEKSAEKVLKKN